MLARVTLSDFVTFRYRCFPWDFRSDALGQIPFHSLDLGLRNVPAERVQHILFEIALGYPVLDPDRSWPDAVGLQLLL
jgi:hypothetical protein